MNAPVRDWLSARMTASAPKRDSLTNPPLQKSQGRLGRTRRPQRRELRRRQWRDPPPPLPFHHEKRDKCARLELDADSDTDQHPPKLRGDHEGVDDDENEQHEVDLAQKNGPRARFKSQISHKLVIRTVGSEVRTADLFRKPAARQFWLSESFG